MTGRPEAGQTRRAARKKPAPGAADTRSRSLRQVFFLETNEK
jgi:hypothetical protein